MAAVSAVRPYAGPLAPPAAGEPDDQVEGAPPPSPPPSPPPADAPALRGPTETAFYAALIKRLRPNLEGQALRNAVKELQDATAAAFPLLPANAGRVANIHERMQASVGYRLIGGDELNDEQLERRFYGLSPNREPVRAVLHGNGLLQPTIDQARFQFWSTIQVDGEALPPFPAQGAEAQRQWILDNRDRFSNIHSLNFDDRQLLLLLPDLLAFPNLRSLDFGTAPVVHLPQFLSLLPLNRITHTGRTPLTVHPDVWKPFEWDSMVEWLRTRNDFRHDMLIGHPCVPAGCIQRALIPFSRGIFITQRLDMVPLRHAVRSALISECLSIYGFVTACTLLTALFMLFCFGLITLLSLFLSPPLATLIYFIILMGVVVPVFLTNIEGCLSAIWCVGSFISQLTISLWTSFVYYVLEPLVCFFAWMFGQGWNPLVRT